MENDEIIVTRRGSKRAERLRITGDDPIPVRDERHHTRRPRTRAPAGESHLSFGGRADKQPEHGTGARGDGGGKLREQRPEGDRLRGLDDQRADRAGATHHMCLEHAARHAERAAIGVVYAERITEDPELDGERAECIEGARIGEERGGVPKCSHARTVRARGARSGTAPLRASAEEQRVRRCRSLDSLRSLGMTHAAL